MYDVLVTAISLAGAAGAGLAAWSLARPGAWSLPGMRWSVRSRFPELFGKATVTKLRDASRRGQRYLDWLVEEAGRPLGWSGSRWFALAALWGAVMGTVFAVQSGSWRTVPVLAVAAPAVLVLIFRGEATAIRHRRQAEVIRLIDGMQVLLQGRSDLYSAIQAAVPMLSDLRPAVERMLVRWGYNPLRALEELHEEVRTEETLMLSAILQHAVLVGAQQTQTFLMQEGEKLERMRRERTEELLRSRPEVMHLALIFPLLAAVLLFVAPFVFQHLVSLNSL